MDKIDILRKICEMPGWQPPEQSSTIERSLQELLNEGWVIPRLDGWEATAGALEAYPNFTLNEHGLVDGHFPEPEPMPAAAPADTVGRYETLVRALLDVMPLAHVVRLLRVTPADLPEDDLAWKVTREAIAAAMHSPTTASASPTS